MICDMWNEGIDCENKLNYHIRNCAFHNSEYTLHIAWPASFVIEDTVFSKIPDSIFVINLGEPSSGLIRNTVFRNTNRITGKILGSITIQSCIFHSVTQLKFEGWSKNTQKSKLVITDTRFEGMFSMFTFEIFSNLK